YEARLEGRDLNLTPLEFQLLVLLMEYAGLVLTRQQILDRIWGEGYFGTPRLVDVHIRSLRSKLGDDPANPRWIETIRGVGYKFKETP
ncbi:MAG TPA: helix-turn-helix domain-containing protein, partial [Sphingobacteriaceae bacterium]|nr:helix-turn-helix domain-containing protein [Sphingobacteriaceae bacterium]